MLNPGPVLRYSNIELKKKSIRIIIDAPTENPFLYLNSAKLSMGLINTRSGESSRLALGDN